jgi:hypothetical protein
MTRADERPPSDEWISLAQAAQMFDPPRSRKALDQLHRRGVLRVWNEGGRLYTSEQSLRQYVASSPRKTRLREPREAEGLSRIEALETLVAELSAENAALRIRLIELEHSRR